MPIGRIALLFAYSTVCRIYTKKLGKDLTCDQRLYRHTDLFVFLEEKDAKRHVSRATKHSPNRRRPVKFKCEELKKNRLYI